MAVRPGQVGSNKKGMRGTMYFELLELTPQTLRRYAPTGFVPSVGYGVTSIPVRPHFPSSYEGVFGPDKSFNEVYFGSSSGVPVGASGSNSLVEMEPTPPASDNGTSEMEPSVVYTPHAWTEAPGARWDPTSSWTYPVQPEEFSDSGRLAPYLGMQLAAPPIQMPGPSVTSGPSHFAVTPTSSGFSMIPPSTSALLLSRGDPVAVTRTLFAVNNFFHLESSFISCTAHFRSLAELSDPWVSTTFQCMWRNRTRGTRCNAVIAGDKQSVSRHLRDDARFPV
ncbi:hypothetical protein JVU11DRAFT_2450 [Chiua virens]|nr:hypothetical protein JVU11DRAFT_2450 [Chiua virens]